MCHTFHMVCIIMKYDMLKYSLIFRRTLIVMRIALSKKRGSIHMDHYHISYKDIVPETSYDRVLGREDSLLQ